MSWASTEGTPSLLGVTWVEEDHAYNFALYSKHAWGVTLLLFAEDDVVTPLFQYDLNHLRNKSGFVWHCRVRKDRADAARYYAYRVSGPPPAVATEWHRFDSDKILLDPYATSVFFPESFDRDAAAKPGSTAGKAPLGYLSAFESSFDWAGDRRPVHESDTVIYELHVRAFTMNPNSGVSSERRGTYRGIIEKIPYLKDLGITVVELMPVLQNDPQEGSHWGYMPLNFFAPDQRYAGSGPPVWPARRIQRDGARPSPGGYRGGHRCRVQPHGGGRCRRPGALVPRHRQQHVLRDIPCRAWPIRELLRNREHLALCESGRTSAGARLASTLGARHARRWIPFRSRLGVRPEQRRKHEFRRSHAYRRCDVRSGTLPPATDRGAVGCCRPLSTREKLSRTHLVPVERAIPG